MRRSILIGTVAFVIGGMATGGVLSQAQSAPPLPVDGAPPQAMGPRGHGSWGWHRPGGGGMRRLALIFRQPDRQLSPADVQKIAEAFLLWNGNHTWKVSEVAATADGPIGFSLVTPEGSVVAKFTMDPHTGRLTRSG